MSGTGPDSIPTSADPRSKRPTKKRALSPASSQAASLDALFAKPDQDIRLPLSAAERAARGNGLRPPPEIVTNVQGSSAGAGSGEFHVYKAARRREYERLRLMDDELKREQDTEEFERTKADKDAKDDEKTRKNREKREKMKARKAKAALAKIRTAGGGGNVEGKTNEAGEVGGAVKANPSAMRSRTQDEDEDNDIAEEEQRSGGDGERAVGAGEPVGLVIHDDD